ncbi:MAG: response regulator [Hellea sp.]|nr:response regulator [Hellea sp.]
MAQIALPISLGLFALIIIALIIRRKRRREEDRSVANLIVDQNQNSLPDADLTDPIQTAKKAEEIQPDQSSRATPKAVQAILPEMAAISRAAELIKKTAPSDEMRQLGSTISLKTQKVQRVLNTIQFITAPDNSQTDSKAETLNFRALLTKLIHKWKSEFQSPGLTFTAHIDEQLPKRLFLHRQSLIAILDNLLHAASESTKTGRVHLHVTGTPGENFDWTLSLIIADTGTGFTDIFLDSLEEGFANPENYSASEVLIAGSRKIANLHNYLMTTQSKLGRGTEVRITLPTRAAMVMRDDKQEQRPAVRSSAPLSPLSNKRVLIIEDDISSQEVLQTFLEPEGCDIDCIADGQHALKTLRQSHYDLILMDIRMPVLDGIETTKSIRSSGEKFSNIPIIAITADTAPETNAKCMMAGIDLFLTKPVSAKGLFDGTRFVMELSADLRKQKSS